MGRRKKEGNGYVLKASAIYIRLTVKRVDFDGRTRMKNWKVVVKNQKKFVRKRRCRESQTEADHCRICPPPPIITTQCRIVQSRFSLGRILHLS